MGATLPERRHELARHLRFGATLLERDPEVARHLRFGATSKSDKVKLLQLLERPHHSDTQRSLGLCRFESNEQAGSDVPQRLPEVAPSTQSDLLERRAEVAPRLLFGRTYDLSRAFRSFCYARFTLSKPMFKYLL
ncbi:hypothetical protein F2Q68_00021734 [Brassica cretica]|uniref:Uncharacterized protein n=1 Tax=Brassica cretica TaxID=69181 RepID=A0A8S9FXZ6_BRACR|nr:hypothetical protein F2Q68_00021734 [Brassica cretica]